MGGKVSYDPIIFCQRESLNMEDFIVGTYLFKGEPAIRLCAPALWPVEQTTGTWMRVPDETDEVRQKHVGRVIAIYNVPGYEANCPEAERTASSRSLSPGRLRPPAPEMLSTVFGNISMCDNLKLLDLESPRKFTDAYRRPSVRRGGLRKLSGALDHPPVSGDDQALHRHSHRRDRASVHQAWPKPASSISRTTS
jgi:2,3-diketo-5-methylthiopentyl-1-phosphate enolase